MNDRRRRERLFCKSYIFTVFFSCRRSLQLRLQAAVESARAIMQGLAGGGFSVVVALNSQEVLRQGLSDREILAGSGDRNPPAWMIPAARILPRLRKNIPCRKIFTFLAMSYVSSLPSPEACRPFHRGAFHRRVPMPGTRQ